MHIGKQERFQQGGHKDPSNTASARNLPNGVGIAAALLLILIALIGLGIAEPFAHAESGSKTFGSSGGGLDRVLCRPYAIMPGRFYAWQGDWHQIVMAEGQVYS